jgi:hypothetical protein
MRKENKLRPYRVDYFDIDEMKDNDLCLVKSVIVRAVTSAEAIYHDTVAQDGRIILRASRFYKKLVHKKDIYKAVEELFSANKAVKIMDTVEAYRAKKTAPPAPVVTIPQPPVQVTTGPDSPATVAVVADLNGMLAHDAHEQTMDTFVATSIPDGKRLPDPTNALPVLTKHWQGCACPVCEAQKLPTVTPEGEYPLVAKIIVYGGLLLLVVKLVLYLLGR